ncbi:MAG: gamma-glutamylcyclotransferase [Leptolyngbyaceae cyanobacterium MAG.088]|nr:gamma-glutamylcyclotransferase [Leptolyngbyaceae cyanobacterium MAG.088]
METIDVFVYGTLKPGGVYHQQYCGPYLKKSQSAQAQGLLYDLPALGYPVMTMGKGWVKGYLFTLDAAAITGLDYLEGYNPDKGKHPMNDDDSEEDYVRQRIMTFDLAAQPLKEAWIYVMAEPPNGAVFLSTGEWPLPHT